MEKYSIVEQNYLKLSPYLKFNLASELVFILQIQNKGDILSIKSTTIA